MEGAFRYLRHADLLSDAKFMEGMGATTEAAQAAIDSALEQAVKRGTLLQASLDFENGPQEIYFLNSPKGRAALRAIQSGSWRLTGENSELAPAVTEPPNIFRLYEENIGPLTPMIADELTEAEAVLPAGLDRGSHPHRGREQQTELALYFRHPGTLATRRKAWPKRKAPRSTRLS